MYIILLLEIFYQCLRPVEARLDRAFEWFREPAINPRLLQAWSAQCQKCETYDTAPEVTSALTGMGAPRASSAGLMV